MVQIHEEIDLVIKQANRYIQYQNKRGTFNEAINNQTKDIDNEKFQQAQTYWNEAQERLIDRDMYSTGYNA